MEVSIFSFLLPFLGKIFKFSRIILWNDRFEFDLRNLSLTRSKNFIFYFPLVQLSNKEGRSVQKERRFQNFILSIEFYLYSLVFVRSGTPGISLFPRFFAASHVYLSMKRKWNGENKKFGEFRTLFFTWRLAWTIIVARRIRKINLSSIQSYFI